MATYIWVNIGSGYGLFAWRHQAIPGPILINHKWSLVANTRGQLHMKNSRHYIPDVGLTVTKLVLLPHLSGINELNLSVQSLLIGHVYAEHNQTKTKRLPFCGRHFQIHFSCMMIFHFWICIQIALALVPMDTINIHKDCVRYWLSAEWVTSVIWNMDCQFADAYMLHSASVS